MNKLNIFLIVLLALLIFTVPKHIPKNHTIVYDDKGYSPSEITINKNDKVTFAGKSQHVFWPASNPHPNHTNFPDFDSKKGIKPPETWSFTFRKAGVVTYHDHLDPAYRGKISVKETNVFFWLYAKTADFLRLNFSKHNDKYLENVAKLCTGNEWEDRKNLIDCWSKYFSGLEKDFGPKEALSVLNTLTGKGKISLSDCHNYADQIGSDAYWSEVSGRKFKIDKSFGICSHGFFHGYMLEHVSHGQDFEASFKLCDETSGLSESMARECYVGAGNGLMYYYWSNLGNDLLKIVQNSKLICAKTGDNKDNCIYGIYGGMEHLYLKIHGSDFSVNQTDPFFVCIRESENKYKPYCYEKTVRPLFSDLGFDVVKIASWISKIGDFEIMKAEAKNIGNFVSQFWIYKSQEDLLMSIGKCKVFTGILYNSCVEGVFEGIFSNLLASQKISDFDCEMDRLTAVDKQICKSKKIESENSVKTDLLQTQKHHFVLSWVYKNIMTFV